MTISYLRMMHSFTSYKIKISPYMRNTGVIPTTKKAF